ncbi:MAG TPA: cytochrome c3 family protein [Gemmatimonadales bacterium]|nr:cytochrome c3 family protein [Gemmatimonadales bacterium]
MRKLVIVGVVAGVAALGALAPGFRRTAAQPAPAPADSATAPKLSIADSSNLRGPRQPIFFRHDIHAGQYKMQCQYCHYSVDQSSEPGIPSVETCMGCHLVVSGTDSTDRAEIRKLRQFWADSAVGKPKLEWVRVHTIARHAHFPHMRHVKAMGPNACQTCHGDVARMPQVWRVNNVNNMGFCISCHLERKVNRDCTACHY